MKHQSSLASLAALALAVLWLGACSSQESSTYQLVGNWEADAKAMMMASLPEGQEMPPQMEEMMEGSYIHIAFKEDGTSEMAMKMGPQEKKDTGKWEIVSREGDTYRLKLTSKTESGEEKTQDATAVFTDADNVKITIEGEAGSPPMILKRKK